MLDGQSKITVWSVEKHAFSFSWIKICNFCVKQIKKYNLYSSRGSLKGFVLALLLMGEMMESYAVIGVFFPKCPWSCWPFKSFVFVGFFWGFFGLVFWWYFLLVLTNIFCYENSVPKHKGFVLVLFFLGSSTMKHFVSDCVEIQCFDIFLCGCRAKCLAWNHRGN